MQVKDNTIRRRLTASYITSSKHHSCAFFVRHSRYPYIEYQETIQLREREYWHFRLSE